MIQSIHVPHNHILPYREWLVEHAGRENKDWHMRWGYDPVSIFICDEAVLILFKLKFGL